MSNKNIFTTVSLLSALFFFVSAAPLTADSLDPSFGKDGITTTSLNHYGDQAKAAVVDQHGKILVAGVSSNSVDFDFSLARYNEEGSLDKSFNFDGIVTTQIGSGDDFATSIALQKDGKIIVAGHTSNEQNTAFALARYNQDGSLDSQFGLDGISVLPVSGDDVKAHTVAIQKDGSIVVGGSAAGNSGTVAALARFASDGSLDTSFGRDGFILTTSDKATIVRDLLIQDDDTLIVTGKSKVEDLQHIILMRYLANGQPDKRFGNNGSSVTAALYPTETTGTALALDKNGNILVAGTSGTGDKQDIALFRFSPQGKYDASFGTRGMVSTDIQGEADAAYDLVSTEDSILLSGYTTLNGLKDFLLLEYSFPITLPESGNMQSSLNIQKPIVEDTYASSKTLEKIAKNNTPNITITSTSISSSDDTGYGMALQKDNKVVVVGSSEEGNVSSYTVARYTNDKNSKSTDAQARSDQSISPFISTTPITGIKRNAAFTGGTIHDGSGLTFTTRGVVFSIVPYPVLGAETVDPPTPVPLTTDSTATTSSQDTTKSLTSGKTADGTGLGQYGSILSSLAIGTRFYVRAYATDSEGTTYYGSQLTFETKDACFIATAAYGSLSHPHVTTLRTFRDQYLMKNSIGRKFVKQYYNYSPAIAESIDRHPVLRPVVRMILLPFIAILSMFCG